MMSSVPESGATAGGSCSSSQKRVVPSTSSTLPMREEKIGRGRVGPCPHLRLISFREEPQIKVEVERSNRCVICARFFEEALLLMENDEIASAWLTSDSEFLQKGPHIQTEGYRGEFEGEREGLHVIEQLARAWVEEEREEAAENASGHVH
ncbi:unnamed protein product [Amoebophrya sp. A25]|nr:unnamed protein product [Amoebophrya sp. A25]|eukprot:GSA25T00006040001.1